MAIPIRAALMLSTEAFDRGVSRARSSLRTLQSAFSGLIGIASKLTLGFTGLVAGLGAIVTRQTGVISSLRDLSTQLGVNVEFLQRFRYAAEQTGAGSQTADNAIQRLNRRLAEAARGTGAARDVLLEYGIATRDLDGNMRSTEDILMDVSDAMSRVDSGAERNRIAFQLFGREGQALVNTLQGGRDELQGMFNDADRLGVVLTEHATKGVADFGEAWGKLQSLIGGLTNSLTAGLAPALKKVVEQLVDFIQDVAESHGGFEKLGRYLAGQFLKIMQAVVSMFIQVYNVVANMVNGLMPIIQKFGGGTAAVFRDLSKGAELLQGLSDGTTRWNDAMADMPIGAIRALQEEFGSLGNAMSNNLPEAIEFLNSEISRLGDGFSMPNIDPSKIEEWFASLQDAINDQGMLDVFVDRGDWKPEPDPEAEQEIRSWWQRLIDWMKSNTGDLFSEDTWDEVNERVRQTFTDADLHNPGKTLAEGFTDAFQLAEDALTNFITSGKLSFSDLGKHIRDTLARAFIQQQIMNPLMGMLGLGGAAGGAAGAAAGAAGGAGAAVGGSMDAGGRGNAGQPYLLGKGAQPELFIPDSPGTFVPRNTWQNQLGGQEATNITYNINATDARSFRDLVASDPEFIYSVTQVGARRLPR